MGFRLLNGSPFELFIKNPQEIFMDWDQALLHALDAEWREVTALLCTVVKTCRSMPQRIGFHCVLDEAVICRLFNPRTPCQALADFTRSKTQAEYTGKV